MMKKKIILALIAALLCLPVWAMADITVNGVQASPNEDGAIIIKKNNAVVSGSATGVYLEVNGNVTSLTLEDVKITAPDGKSALRLSYDRYVHNINGDKYNQKPLLPIKITVKGNIRLTGGDGKHGIDSYTGATLIGSGNLNATGGDGVSAGNGINGVSVIKIDGRVVARGGKGKPMGYGMGINGGNMVLQGNIKAIGGSGDAAGSGLCCNEVKILAGSIAEFIGGSGKDAGDGIHSWGNLFIDSSKVSIVSGKTSENNKASGIFMRDPRWCTLTVTGNSFVTMEGEASAAALKGQYTGDINNNGLLLMPVKVGDGLRMYAGENAASAVLVDDYTVIEKYLRIESAKQEPEVPQTGDASHTALWLLMAAASAVCLMMLRKRRTA